MHHVASLAGEQLFDSAPVTKAKAGWAMGWDGAKSPPLSADAR